jgi:hypothetical protein
MTDAMGPNAYESLRNRRDAGTLTWRGPALMLFARTACAVGAYSAEDDRRFRSNVTAYFD